MRSASSRVTRGSIVRLSGRPLTVRRTGTSPGPTSGTPDCASRTGGVTTDAAILTTPVDFRKLRRLTFTPSGESSFRAIGCGPLAHRILVRRLHAKLKRAIRGYEYRSQIRPVA